MNYHIPITEKSPAYALIKGEWVRYHCMSEHRNPPNLDNFIFIGKSNRIKVNGREMSANCKDENVEYFFFVQNFYIDETYPSKVS